MGPKKSKKIILILIILLIILTLLAGIAYAYFATDLFKSNKETFFKYIIQMGTEKEGFLEVPLKEYYEKQSHTPYLDEGTISVNITAENGQEQFQNTNQMNLTFLGQVDSANSKRAQDISLNYSEQVKFPLSYKQIKDTIGIKTQYVGSKYIATNINSENDFIQDTKNIEKWQELSNVELSAEEIQRMKDTYYHVLDEQLQDSNFSKIENADAKGYKLTLNGEELNNLMVNLLETLKGDQATLDKINEYLKIQKNSSKITANDIDGIIENIHNYSALEEETLEITVNQKKGKTSSLMIKTKEAQIQLEKNITGNDLQYQFQFQINNNDQIEKIGLIAKYAGLQAMQNITENFELTFETQKVKYQYNYNNNVEFTDSVDIEDLNSDNTLRLDEMQEEDRKNFLEAVTQRIQKVNESQMKELGVAENENPLIYVFPSINTDFGFTMNSQISEQEVVTFNKKFEMYESTNLQGVTVKGLLSTIQLNNENQEDDERKIKEIHFDGQEYEVTDQNITLLKSSIETQTAYRVEFERDEETGVIFRVVINKK